MVFSCCRLLGFTVEGWGFSAVEGLLRRAGLVAPLLKTCKTHSAAGRVGLGSW